MYETPQSLTGMEVQSLGARRAPTIVVNDQKKLQSSARALAARDRRVLPNREQPGHGDVLEEGAIGDRRQVNVCR